MAIGLTPAAIAVQAAFAGADTRTTHNHVAALFNLPPYDDIPRPGIARTWDKDAWLDWARPFDFHEAPRTTHSYVIVHRHFSCLKIGLSSTPGDVSARLNLACDVRIAFRNEYTGLVAMCAGLFRVHPEYFAGLYSEEEVKEELRSWVRTKRHTAEGIKLGCDILKGGIGDDAISKQSTEASYISKRLARELQAASAALKISPRVIVKRILMDTGFEASAGEDSSAIDSVVERIYLLIREGLLITPQMASLLLHTLEDTMDMEEARKVALQEQRLEKRAEQASTASKAAPVDYALDTKYPPAATSAVYSPEATYPEAMAAIRATLAAEADAVVDALAGVSAAAKSLKDFAARFPSPPYPTAELAELEAKTKLCLEQEATIDSLNDKLTTVLAEHELAGQLLEEAGTDINWRHAFTTLVGALRPALSSNDFMALAAGVGTARTLLAEADEKIKKELKT